MTPNKSMELTPVGRFSSFFAVDITHLAWLCSSLDCFAVLKHNLPI